MLTFGLFVLARGPPADAGFVLVQKEEAHQSLWAAAQLHHLGSHLHRAHTFLHWGERKGKDKGKRNHWKVVKSTLRLKTVCDGQTMCIHDMFLIRICTIFHLGANKKRKALIKWCKHMSTIVRRRHLGYVCHCCQGFSSSDGGKRQTTARVHPSPVDKICFQCWGKASRWKKCKMD